MLGRITRRDSPIGIDLSGDRARVLQLASGPSGLSVVASARADRKHLAQDGIDDAGVPDGLVSAIVRKVQAGGFRGKRCLLTLPDTSLRMRTVRHPVMPEQELANAVRFDAIEQLGFTDESPGEIGWLRTGEITQGNDRRAEVLYFGLPRHTAEEIACSFSSAGIEPVGIEPRFVACVRALTRQHRRMSDSEIVQLGLDVNERSTMILITRGADLVFAKLIDLGGEHMNEAAQKRLGIEIDVVRELRDHRASTTGRDTTADERIQRAMFDAVRPVIAEIAREASLCLRHYAVTFRGSRPVRSVLMGTEAEEPLFTDIVSAAIGIETRVFSPLSGVRTEATVGNGIYGPDWASVVGAACRDHLRKVAPRKRYQRIGARSQDAPAKGRAA